MDELTRQRWGLRSLYHHSATKKGRGGAQQIDDEMNNSRLGADLWLPEERTS